jgi:biopolymer transport protein ExbD
MADVDVSQQSRGKSKHSKKKKKRVGVRMDMTPMVDVAFLLLTFFMLTTTMNKPQTMEINLPPTEAKAEVAESNLLTLRISDDFNLFWNIGTEKPVTIEGTDKKSKLVNLGKLLKEKNSANPKLITLVKVDGKAKYIDMVDIMDELNINDITRFSLAPMLDEDKKQIGKL